MRKLWLALALSACAPEGPPEAGMSVEPLLEDGRLPPGLEAMIFGGSRGCRDDLDCESNACVFGACSGLVVADEVWRIERIGERVRARLALQPELRQPLTKLLGEVATREEMGLPFRGRAARALGEVYPPGKAAPAVAELTKLLAQAPPASVAEVIAVTLARLGNPAGLDLVIAVTEDERLASVCEALRALGHVDHPEVLPALLSALSPELDLEVQRAAIDGLATIGDRRAIRPLAQHLVTGPEALANRIARVLAQLTGAALGPDPLAWDAWVSANLPPAPPPYTPRGHDSRDEIDLPTP